MSDVAKIILNILFLLSKIVNKHSSLKRNKLSSKYLIVLALQGQVFFFVSILVLQDVLQWNTGVHLLSFKSEKRLTFPFISEHTQNLLPNFSYSLFNVPVSVSLAHLQFTVVIESANEKFW